MTDTCLQELFNIISKEKILLNEPMKKHTAFKIGGPAEVFVSATSVEEIKVIIQIANKNEVPLHIIGNGSNLLVNDDGVKGIVLKSELKHIDIVSRENSYEITAGSGVVLAALAQKLLQEEITGFEEFSGIPGTIGGAIRMNAGAHGKEMKDIVLSTKYIDMQGQIHTISNREHEFEYRNSMFSKNNYIILETTIKLQSGEKEKIRKTMEEYSAWRREKQPLEYPNAGSTFKRGKDFITAALIDECGLKGYKIGGAQVSTKHAGFVVNTGNATSKDVLDLIEHIKNTVREKTGKTIELEIEVI